MIKRFVLAILMVSALAIGLSLPAFAYTPTVLWENYSANEDSGAAIYGVNWSTQTFTTGTEAHTASQIRLKLYRTGACGTITVSLKKTVANAPNGVDLTSGTINSDNSITTTTTGVWYGIDITPYSLEANTQYAIVVRNLPGTSSAAGVWRMDGSISTYNGGSEWLSTNGGISWTQDTDDDYMFEVWGERLIATNQAQVFTGYLEPDDLLFAFSYNNTYVPYYPNEDPARYFDIRLTNSTGTVTLAQGVCRAWGYKPASIYLSADQAASLTLGSAYRLYLYGIVAGNPNDYYQLTVADWRGDDLTYLDSYILTTAHSMASYYGTDLTTFTGSNEVLNDEGAIIFGIGIPGLSQVRPDLFLPTAQIPEYQPKEWTDAFAGATTWEAQVGPQVAAVFNSLGNMWGIDGKSFGVFLLMAIYITVAGGAALLRSNPVIVAVLCLPFFMLGAWLRLLDIVIIAVMAAVAVFLLMFSFWWSRT